MELTCGPNFIFNFCAKILYFQNFLQNLIETFMSEIFFKVSSKIYPFFHFLISFYKFCHISFIFLKFLYRSFVFEHICTSKFAMTFFICFVYNFVFDEIIQLSV
jgi:hypothetical protein